MGPQQQYNYPYNNNPYPNPVDPDKAFRKKLLLLLCFFVVAVVLLGLVQIISKNRTKTVQVGDKSYTTKSSQAPGTMKVSASGIPDSNGLIITLNSAQLSMPSLISSGSYSKNLPSGSYDLKITKTGYTPFGAQFMVNSGKTTLITANLVPAVDTTLSNWNQIEGASDPVQWDGPQLSNSTPTVSISSIQYFYSKTWAFVTTYDGSSYGYDVVKFDFDSNRWVSVAESDQYFTSSELNDMPSQVVSYLNNNNYTYAGASQ